MFAPSILHRICAFVAEDTCSGHKTLLALAVASKATHEPAIREIWHSLPNLAPLLNCLPDDLWGPAGSVKKRFLRDFQGRDWVRFRKYASLIRSYGGLGVESTQAPRDLPIYQELHRAVNSDEQKCLLPNVKNVFLVCKSIPEIAKYTDIFVSKHLLTLTIKLPGARKGDNQASEQLELYLSLMQKLNFSNYKSNANSKNLRKVEIGSASVKVAYSRDSLLGKSQGSADFDRDCHTGLTRHPGPQSLPLRLCKVAIDCQDIAYCTGFFRHLSPECPIEEIQLTPSVTSNHTELPDLLSLISSRCNHNTLRKLEIIANFFPVPGMEDDALDLRGDHIEPLLVFKNLQSLEIDISGAYHLDDDFVARMATSWNKLQTLRFFTDEDDSERKATLDGLKSLAIHCPDLVSLDMSFNALEKPSTPVEVSCNLEKLNVLRSPIEDVEMIAKYLRSIFPALKRLDSLDFCYRGEESAWMDVIGELDLEEGFWND